VLDTPIAELRVDGLDGEICLHDVAGFQIATYNDELAAWVLGLYGKHVKLSVEDVMGSHTGHHHSRAILWYDKVEDVQKGKPLTFKSAWPRIERDFKGERCDG
jgi:hypothetical protein